MAERLAALKSDGSLGFWRENDPRCPHCGHVCDVNELEWWDLYADDGHEVEKDCPSCDLQFLVTVVTTHSFSTDEQPEDE